MRYFRIFECLPRINWKAAGQAFEIPDGSCCWHLQLPGEGCELAEATGMNPETPAPKHPKPETAST